MENKIKAKIFAMYLGQRCISLVNEDDNIELKKGDIYQLAMVNLPNSFIQVVSEYDSDSFELGFHKEDGDYWIDSSITDEHLMEIAYLYYGYKRIRVNSSKEKYIEVAKNHLNQMSLEVFQYLQSLGYAMPITIAIDGKPVTYSVEELIKENVIILEG